MHNYAIWLGVGPKRNHVEPLGKHVAPLAYILCHFWPCCTTLVDVAPKWKKLRQPGRSCAILEGSWAMLEGCCTILAKDGPSSCKMHHLGVRCTILVPLWAMVSLISHTWYEVIYDAQDCSRTLRSWWCSRNTPCWVTMLDVGLLVFIMHYLYIMMLHYGSWCSIMSVVDAHLFYVTDECSISYCMVDYDWLTPFMRIWANRLGLLGF